jgi:cyclophilin family peptidyl-prolyl cis-trans isomerase/protein-disulfide isomerase
MKLKTIIVFAMILLTACGQTVSPTAVSSTARPPSSPTPLPCSSSLAEPTPISGVESRFPPVSAADWTRGPADAPVTIIIYDDFQCVECNDQVLSDLMKAHPKDLQIVYRYFPQPALFDKGLLAAQAAEAAGAQDRFWELHDLLFARQAEWVTLKPDEFKSWVANEAETLGLDRARFEADFNSAATIAKVQKAADDGKAAGIPVLPLVLINGQIYSAPKEYYAFDQVIRLTALSRKQFTACPQMTIDPGKQYLATLKTSKGDIVIELYADKAPLTVNSFVFLARKGWYDGIAFYLVIPNVLAQTGDPSETGIGGPGYMFRDEIVPSLHYDKPGMVGMANLGPDTNGSQFFITFTAQPSMNGRSTIFGHVISGMDVLAKITPRDPNQVGLLADGDIIISVTIEER